MSRNKSYRFTGALFLAVSLITVAGCKKNVPTPAPTEEPKPAELKVMGVNPKEGRSDQTTNVSISGLGFQPGAKVMVGDNVAQDVYVASSTTVRATIPSGLPVGAYNVMVRNPDGKESVLTGGFSVVAPPVVTPPKPADCSLEVIYFDFDRSNLSDDARGQMSRNYDCLKTRKARKVEVQGHTDERGSTDYNLALGQRRADEAKRYLSQLGFSNLTSVSYGEESPAVAESNEDAWSKNRRVEIRILE
jgi:outer membrane protein OmpA-like peptidoglycan-associated protein